MPASAGYTLNFAIARALAMDPKLVLLDEITSALDPERVQEVLATVKSLAGEAATLLLVTHEMRFARDASHKVVGRRARSAVPRATLASSNS